MLSRSWSGVVPVGEGCPGAVSACLSGTLTVEGSWCGDIGLLMAGGLRHFFVRSRVACVVPRLLWCVLRVSVVWPRHTEGGKPCGALARLVGPPVPRHGAGARNPGLQGGGLRGSSANSLFGLLVCCGSPWPRVCGILSPRQRTGR